MCHTCIYTSGMLYLTFTLYIHRMHYIYIGYIEEWVQDIKAKERDLNEMLEKVKSTLRESNTRPPSSSGTSNTLPTSLTSSEAEMNKLVEQAKIVVKKVCCIVYRMFIYVCLWFTLYTRSSSNIPMAFTTCILRYLYSIHRLVHIHTHIYTHFIVSYIILYLFYTYTLHIILYYAYTILHIILYYNMLGAYCTYYTHMLYTIHRIIYYTSILYTTHYTLMLGAYRE